MKHRISAGAIVVVDGRVLLVRHLKEQAYDFWVAPGGGIIDEEDIYRAAEREVREETALSVDAIKPIYLEQFYQPGIQHIKTWVLCRFLSGELSTAAPEATREHIVEARFLDKTEVTNLAQPVFPAILRDQFWVDCQREFPEFRYLGNRAMEFY